MSFCERHGLYNAKIQESSGPEKMEGNPPNFNLMIFILFEQLPHVSHHDKCYKTCREEQDMNPALKGLTTQLK